MHKERTALALTIVVPLILIVGYFKSELLDSSIQAQELEWDRFWIWKTHRTDQFDMILVGDSRLYRGLSPTTMQTVLKDMHILNFGYSSGGLNPEIYASVEQRLSPTSTQPIVVIGITPLSLTPNAADNEQYHQYLEKTAYERFFTLHFSAIQIFFEPFTPKTLLALLPLTSTSEEENTLTQEYHDDGWIASHYVQDDPNKALTSYRTVFNDNQVSEELVQELIDQTQQWSQQGILVFGFRFPSMEQMVRLENELSGFDEATLKEDFVNAGGIWLDIPADGYRSYDGSHLHKDAAGEFSIDLAEMIQEYLDSP